MYEQKNEQRSYECSHVQKYLGDHQYTGLNGLISFNFASFTNPHPVIELFGS